MELGSSWPAPRLIHCVPVSIPAQQERTTKKQDDPKPRERDLCQQKTGSPTNFLLRLPAPF
ncbi:MAG: hypothetical protein ACP5FH_02505, partial [Terracidiphilus sp.]